MLFLLAAVFGAATQAQAQAPTCGDTSIWCATLTLGSSSTEVIMPAGSVGWSPARDLFDEDDVTYGVGHNNMSLTFDASNTGRMFFIGYDSASGGELWLNFFGGGGNEWLETEANRDSLTFKVGSEFFNFEDADWDGSENRLTWTSTVLTWAAGDEVMVSIETKSTADDATLSALSLSEGSNPVPLSPAFSSSTDDYTASVDFRVEAIEVTATANHSDATVTILPGDDYTAPDGHQLFLSVGSRAITVTVTHGSTTGAYTVTVTRQSGSDPTAPNCVTDAFWCGTLVAGSSSTMPTLFGWHHYTGLVNDAITYGTGHSSRSMTFEAGSAGSVEQLENDNAGNGTLKLEFESGTWLSTAVNRNTLGLRVGSRTFNFEDATWNSGHRILTWTNSGLDWSAGDLVTFNIVEKSTDDDATLSGLSLETGGGNAVSLTPSFASGTTSYSALVSDPVRTIEVTPTKSASSASVTISPSDADSNTTGHQINFPLGGSLAVTVTVVDGSTTGAYTVTVTREAAPSAPTCVTNSIWCATLTVGSSSSNPTGFGWSSSAHIQIEDAIAYGAGYGPVVTLSTADGGTRELDGIFNDNAGNGTLKINFVNKAGVDWFDTAANRNGLILQVGGTTFDFEDATWKTTGQPDNDTLTWTSTGLNWSVGEEVTIHIVEKSASDDARLSGLTVAEGSNTISLSPGFSSATTSYAASVPFRVRRATLTATPNNSGATVTILPADAYSGPNATPGHQLDLSTGPNALTVTVTHGSTTGMYLMTVTRQSGSFPSAPTCVTDSIWCGTLFAGSSSTMPTLFGWRRYVGLVNDVLTYGTGQSRTVTFDGPSNTGNLYLIELDNGTLKLRFEDAGWLNTAANRNSLSFRVGDDTFDFEDAGWNSGQQVLTWSNSNLSWSVGEEVTVNIVEKDSGTAAAGDVTITGPPQVGQTLTADTSGITDADGLTSPGYAYQWIRAGTPDMTISGQTGSTYAVTAADVGEQLKVKVDFTDDASNPETKTSEATVPVVTAASTQCLGGQVEVELWCATLTSGSDGTDVGYVSDASPALGSLTGGNTFDFDGTTYTVTRLHTYLDSFEPDLVFAVSPALPRVEGEARLSLHIEKASGTLILPLSDGTYGTLDTNHVQWEFLGAVTRDLKLHGEFTSPALGATADGVRLLVYLSVKPAVSFGSSSYTATEGGSSAEVEVRVDPPAGNSVVVPITTTNQGGAADGDYSGVPASLTFVLHAASRTFTVTATDDSDNDDGESVKLALGSLPSGVVAGSQDETVLNLTDNDGTEVTVSFGSSSYTATEGGTAAMVVVSLSSVLTVQVVVPLTATAEGGATAPGQTGADYSAVPSSLTFAVGDQSKTFTVTATNDVLDEGDEQVKLAFGTLPTGVTAGSTTVATVSLADNDAEPVLAFGDASEDEGGAIAFEVTMAESGRTVTVSYATSVGDEDTATSGTDFTATSGVLTFTPGDTAKTVEVTTSEDAVNEGDETFTLTLSGAMHATLPSDPTATGTIDNDDAEGDLSVQAASAMEGNTISFAVGAPASGLTVTVDYATSLESGDTASAGDFTAASGTLTFEPGAGTRSQTVPVSTVEDALDEDNETFTLTLSNAANMGLPSDPTATGTITDDDPAPALSVGDADETEGGTIEFAVTMAASGKTVTVSYATSVGSSDTAVSGTDFTASSGTLTFAPGDTAKTVEVETLEDETDEDDETFTLTLSSVSNATLPSDPTAEGTINDDDAAGALAVADGSGEEGGPVNFTVTAPTSEKTVTVSYATSVGSGDTATTGTDFTAKSGTLTFMPGTTGMTVAVSTREDSADEDDETFTLTLTNAMNATLPSDPTTATGTIEDDDAPPVLAFDDADATEGSEVAFEVSLSPASGKTVTVDYATSVESGDTASSGDFTATSGTLTFGAGTTELTVEVPTTNDVVDEEDETFTLTLSNPGNATLPADVDKTGTIEDNDNAPMLTLSVNDNEIDEGDTTRTAVLTAVISGSSYAADQEVTLTFTGTATEGSSSDYTVSGTSLTLAGETAGASATATVTVIDDDVDEAVNRETIVAELKLDGTVVSRVTITVVDDDTRGLSPSATRVEITETDGSATETYTLELASEPTANVTVTLSVSGANTLTTVPQVSLTSLTFTPSNWDQTQQVTVTAPADNDAVDERATIAHAVASGGDYGASENATVTVAVDDDETASTEVGVTPTPATVDEGAGATDVVLTAALDAGAFKTARTVTVGLSRGSDTEAGDYAAPATVRVTIAAQATSGTATFTLTPANDDLWEPEPELLLLVGQHPLPPGLMTFGSSRITLIDDDPEPQLSFTATGAEMAEAGGSVELVAAITNGVGFEGAQTVNLDFTGGNATAPGQTGADYTQSPSGSSLTLAAGVVSASATLTLTAVDDTVDEDDGTAGLDSEDERISVQATHGSGTSMLDTTLEVAILDDDHPVVTVMFGNSGRSLPEGQLQQEMSVRLTVPAGNDGPERELVIPLTQTPTGGATMQGEAKADYSGVPASVTFAATPLTAAKFVVAVTDDAIDDDGEGVRLGFGTMPDSAVSAGNPSTSWLRFADNDERGFAFGYVDGNIVQEGNTLRYTLALTSEPTANVTVTFDAHPRKNFVVLQDGADNRAVTSLTFTPSDWETERNLLYGTNTDANSVTETEQFGHTGSGGDYAGYRQTLEARVVDLDAAASGVLLGVNPQTVGEGAGPTAVTVTATLDGAALAVATTVAVTVSGTSASTSDYTVSPSALTIVIGANAAQASGTVTLTPAADTAAEDDETVTVSGTSALAVTAATVTIEDDDTRGVTVSESLLELDEGDTATYTVGLDTAPSGAVTVTVSSGDASVTAEPETLVFTATDQGPKAVTVTAEQDADAANVSTSLTHAVSGADYGSNNVPAAAVAVTVDDDEEGSSGVELELSPDTVDEGAGATEVAVTARLDGGALLQDVTVQVVLAAGTAEASDYRLDRGRLSIRIPQGMLSASTTVMLTPVDDGVDEDDAETILASGTASGGLPVIGARLTILDDDTRGVTVTPTALALDEQDSGTYTVALDSAPTGSVTVTLSATGAAEASVRVSPGALVFTASDHGAKTVTVSARGDRDEAGGRVTVAHTVTGADYATETASAVTVDVTDTGIVEWDVQLSVDDVSLLAEGGGARTLTVTAELLTGVQTVAVPVSVTVTGETASASDFRASPASFTLTIPAGQAMASRPMTVTPTDDGIDEEDETLVVAPRVADHLTTNEAGVELTIADDDTRGVTVAPTVLELAEGAGGSYTVSLGSQPSGSVTVSVTLSGSASVTANRSSLVFTGSNWRSAQAVRVTAGQDADPDDESVTVTHGVTGADYDGEPAGSVQVTVTDDDKPSEAVRLSMTPDTVAEGAGASTLTVTGMLDASARVDAMEVELTIPAGDGYTAVGGTLTIAAGAVSGTARLTLTPEDDNADLENFPVTVEAATTAQATLAGGAMQPMRLEPGTLTVTIEDDDERGVTVTPTALTVAEGGSGEYTVVLHSEPDGGAVAVTLSLSDAAGTNATALPSSLTFQASDWGTAQTVTVTVPEDLGAVEADATATVTHAVLGADYGSNNVPAAAVTVTVPGYELTEAGDGVLLLVSGGAAMIPSGTPAPAGLSLAFPAAHDGQTVTVMTVPAPGDAPRGFSLGDTDTVVDISGVELGSGETATVCLPVSAGGELSVQRWDEANQVWVELDEPPGGSPPGRVCGVTGQFSVFAVMVRLEEPELVFSADALTVTIGEEEGATYTVALGLEPAGSVTVTVTGHEGTELSVAPATLVFTEGDWNVAQAVTATVSDEAEAGSEAVLTHTASGGRYLEDWEKTLAVTVERDSGLLQRAREAWLARFGRTAAGHVAEAVAERLAAPAGQETQLALGGAQPRQALVAGVLQTLAGESRPDGRRMLADSAFVLALGSDGEQSWTAWGRGAYTEFDGEEDGLELDGEVASGTLGVDVERGDWRLGLALSHSEGEGEIREAEGDRYELESSLTGAYPYARWQLDETLSVWGVLGWGEGELEQERDGERTETDLEMRMAAFGARGRLGGVEFGSGTFELSLKSDLLAVRVEADADEDEDLPEVEADAQRVRVLLEGAGHCPLESGGVLAPTLEAGLRYDEGDAETGLGAELGAGLRYADGSGRLSAVLNARGLLAHEESGYEEWGVSGSLRLEPDGSGRGLSLTLESALGATGSGTDELWARRDLSGLARDDDFEAAGRLRAEMGLGLNAPGGLGTITPYVGYERMDNKSVWHLGGRLKAGPDLAIGLEGSMHRGGGDSDRQELKLNLSGRW